MATTTFGRARMSDPPAHPSEGEDPGPEDAAACSSCGVPDETHGSPGARPRPFDARRVAWAAVALAVTAGALWFMQSPGFVETCAAIALVLVATVVFLVKVLEAGVF
jgi:hypothetical protein